MPLRVPLLLPRLVVEWEGETVSATDVVDADADSDTELPPYTWRNASCLFVAEFRSICAVSGLRKPVQSLGKCGSASQSINT